MGCELHSQVEWDWEGQCQGRLQGACLQAAELLHAYLIHVLLKWTLYIVCVGCCISPVSRLFHNGSVCMKLCFLKVPYGHFACMMTGC
jgi:hypothetical protein